MSGATNRRRVIWHEKLLLSIDSLKPGLLQNVQSLIIKLLVIFVCSICNVLPHSLFWMFVISEWWFMYQWVMIIDSPMYTVRLVHVMWPGGCFTPETFLLVWSSCAHSRFIFETSQIHDHKFFCRTRYVCLLLPGELIKSIKWVFMKTTESSFTKQRFLLQNVVLDFLFCRLKRRQERKPAALKSYWLQHGGRNQ